MNKQNYLIILSLLILNLSNGHAVIPKENIKLDKRIEEKYFQNCININAISQNKNLGQYICYSSDDENPFNERKKLEQKKKLLEQQVLAQIVHILDLEKSKFLVNDSINDESGYLELTDVGNFGTDKSIPKLVELLYLHSYLLKSSDELQVFKQQMIESDCKIKKFEELKEHSLLRDGKLSIILRKDVSAPKVITNIDPNHFSGKIAVLVPQEDIHGACSSKKENKTEKINLRFVQDTLKSKDFLFDERGVISQILRSLIDEDPFAILGFSACPRYVGGNEMPMQAEVLGNHNPNFNGDKVYTDEIYEILESQAEDGYSGNFDLIERLAEEGITIDMNGLEINGKSLNVDEYFEEIMDLMADSWTLGFEEREIKEKEKHDYISERYGADSGLIENGVNLYLSIRDEDRVRKIEEMPPLTEEGDAYIYNQTTGEVEIDDGEDKDTDTVYLEDFENEDENEDEDEDEDEDEFYLDDQYYDSNGEVNFFP